MDRLRWRRRTRPEGMFKIRSFPKKNLKWWHENTASIDFDPDFQRTARAWKGRDQAFLIDSILNGYDIPKIYIADFTRHDVPDLNRHKKDYALIDGKQRLNAINKFLADDLPLGRKFVLLANPALTLGGMTFSELKEAHPNIANIVERYVLDVKSIETDDREKINDVFLRLNKASKALNGAEVRNAMIGKAVDGIRDLAKRRFFAKRISFSTARLQERNAAAKVLYLEYEGGAFVDTKKRNLDAFVLKVGSHASSQFNGAMKRAKAQLDILAEVFENDDPLLGAEGQVPLYYMFVSRLNAADRKKVRKFMVRFERDRVK